ncbi:MAG: 23S rRNA (pseudouridine(1915)-N(3))-methyltransferase RlmH [Deltaproteobacteria bacterium]|nr:23S rRNA (pseudouridine(1915)-N(3))-methyltransferase RlmH [Deltaproteobacteria bacterium]
MRIRILSFGHKRDELYGAALAEYQKRIVKPWTIEMNDLPTGRKSEREAAAVVMRREAEALADLASPWVLDVGGTAVSTEQLADWLRGAQDGGTKQLAFIIGGADGIDATVKQRAARRLSLSKLTLPHRLARVVLIEQIYRAQTILRGEAYHK